MADLATTTALLGLLADPTRVRLMALVAEHELSVAELVRISSVPQSRVSTHLGKLRDAGLVRDRKAGTSTYYRAQLERMPLHARAAWSAVAGALDDVALADDRRRCDEVLRARESSSAWADSVAGRMEHAYSPGRTWEATARAFVGLVQLGDVLDLGSGDGVNAELLAPRSRSYTCLDRSEKVLDAARTRLSHLPNVAYVAGDMHDVPLPDRSFDAVLMFSVLTYAERPAGVLAEANRLLRPDGSLVLVTLDAHNHTEVSTAYEHVNTGFSPAQLGRMLADAGFSVERCEVATRERRKPYFDVVFAFARGGARPARRARPRLVADSTSPATSARRLP